MKTAAVWKHYDRGSVPGQTVTLPTNLENETLGRSLKVDETMKVSSLLRNNKPKTDQQRTTAFGSLIREKKLHSLNASSVESIETWKKCFRKGGEEKWKEVWAGKENSLRNTCMEWSK